MKGVRKMADSPGTILEIKAGDAWLANDIAETLQACMDSHVRAGHIGPVTQTMCEVLACLMGFAYTRLEDQSFLGREQAYENAIGLVEDVYDKLAPAGESLTKVQVLEALGVSAVAFAEARENYGAGELTAEDGRKVSRGAAVAGVVLATCRALMDPPAAEGPQEVPE